MEKEFVPYELGLKLKELGFNEPTLATYVSGRYGFDEVVNKLEIWNDEDVEILHSKIKAPLWQQAFDWCLDKLKLIENYAILKDSDSYNLVIIDYYNNEIEKFITTTTKEECLKKLIKLIE